MVDNPPPPQGEHYVQIAPPAQKKNRVWMWILGIFLIVFAAPAVGCASFGLSLGLSSSTGSTNRSTGGPAIGLIRLDGAIYSGESSGYTGVAGSETLVRLINEANENDSIKAIILRVDSPGGGVVASDEIYHTLSQVEKPVVISVGSMAASGGYYVSMAGDYIYANPHSFVGSIGVISQFVTAEEFLDEIGIDVFYLTAGESKDFGSIGREMTEEEIAYWQNILNETHLAFIEIVAEGRGMSVAEVTDLADGRVYLGTQALELGLIDELGYFEDAIAKAADLGGISGEPRIVEFSPAPGLFDSLYGYQAGQATSSLPIEILREMLQPSLEFRFIGPGANE